MNKETFEALKYVIGYLEIKIEENKIDKIGQDILIENLKQVEDWIDEVAKDYTDTQESINNKISF